MATRSLLQRLRSPGLRKRLSLICWLILAAFLALYGVTICLALLGGVNLHPILIPLLKALIRPLEIGACLMYPLACWLGWTRRSLAAILSRWNYPLAGFHILAGCIAFIAGWACAYTQHRSSAPGREARER